MPIWLGAQKVGVKSDGFMTFTAPTGQDKYLPIVAAIKVTAPLSCRAL